jgi:hypothetical protein
MISDDRKKWRDVKQKHAAAIKQAKIDFNLGLGKILDRMYDKIGKDDAEAKKKASDAKKLVTTYLGKLGTLRDPARKDLRDVLQHLETVLDDVASWKA